MAVIFGMSDFKCSICGKPRSQKVHQQCSRLKQRHRQVSDERKGIAGASKEATAESKPTPRL